ncbi:MAG: DUF167 domain-containing protein [Planctomycetota bacterium]
MPITQSHPAGAILAVKVVPGASREKVVGPLGERLKVTVRKPAERGAANRALCKLLADALGVRPGDVEVLRGEGRPEKDLLVRGLAPDEVSRRLGLA